MSVAIVEILGRVSGGENLSLDEMSATMDAVMDGGVADEQIALLLTALRAKGETAKEIAGAALAMRRHMRPIRSRRTGLIDTCGTGGDGSQTFNISTAAAIVTAAAGVPVAKHGNRGMSSRSGSADALAALGVNVNADVPLVEECLDTLGICFCFAPLLHPAVKRVTEVRKRLGVPTIFNLLGPLSNPAGASFQLLGIGKPHLRHTLAEVLALLGVQRAAVVCGDGHLDEVTISGPTEVTEVSGGELRDFTWTPADFGLDTSPLDSLKVSSPEESAALIRRVLSGERGPARDIVLINSAAALWLAGKAESRAISAALAATAIDTGTAQNLLEQLATLTNR